MESLLPFLSSGASLGEALRDQGMARVAAANPDWIEAARAALLRVAGERAFFTAQDLWPHLEGYGVTDNRALGPVLRWGAKNRFIAATHGHELSERPACHRRPVRVWRSLRINGGM